MSDLSPTLQLASELISRPSVTPDDQGCLKVIGDRLQAIGFELTDLRFDDVDNLWAVFGESGPLFCFAGHTDVVPTGDRDAWEFPPFEPTIADGMICGRGAADMKGSLAAMVVACEEFLSDNSNPTGRIAFLLTSDEEGPAINGTVKVVEWLQQRSEKIDWCLVGEPSSTDQLGDVVKNGRRGSLGASLVIEGTQGHVAYPHLAENPTHTALAALQEITSTEWDNGNQFFPPTSFQISNMQAGTGATNVIPGELHIECNFRFSTESTPQQLTERFETVLKQHGLNYRIEWTLFGSPFLTDSGRLLPAVSSAINEICGYPTQPLTTGGTSDGRFIAPTGAEVVELGPRNATIHKIDERVMASDLDQLALVYQRILEKLLG